MFTKIHNCESTEYNEDTYCQEEKHFPCFISSICHYTIHQHIVQGGICFHGKQIVSFPQAISAKISCLYVSVYIRFHCVIFVYNIKITKVTFTYILCMDFSDTSQIVRSAYKNIWKDYRKYHIIQEEKWNVDICGQILNKKNRRNLQLIAPLFI